MSETEPMYDQGDTGPLPVFEIDLAPVGHSSSVKMDGRELGGLRSIDVSTTVDGLTAVNLEFVAVRVIGRASGQVVVFGLEEIPSEFLQAELEMRKA